MVVFQRKESYMAQIELSLGSGLPLEAVRELPRIVNVVHYGADSLNPGDITMAVVKTQDVESIATITEGCDNWPKDNGGLFLPEEEMRVALDGRAKAIYEELGTIASRDLVIVQSNGICPSSVENSGIFEFGPSIKIREFCRKTNDKERRMLTHSYNEIARIYRLRKPEDMVVFPEMDRELSVSDAVCEIECILPRSDIRFNSDPDYLSKVAGSIARYMLLPAKGPVNCFIQGENGTGWGKAS